MASLPMEASARDVDVPRLTVLLEALANSNRLEILLQLREPKTASQIVLHPPVAREGENPDRAISRQAVRVHLERLSEIGVVEARRVRRDAAMADEYVVNQQRLFAIAEEFRRVASLRSSRPAGAEVTLDGRPPTGKAVSAGVRLILVHGLDEGRVFHLPAGETSRDRGWVIGRQRGLPISLDYDPFVSSENSEVTWDRGRYVVHDLRTSRNGTSVNWQSLAKGGNRELENGDVIGVGRSLLLFRRD